MSGLFRRLSSRRSDGPEGAEPPAQAEPGATDAPASAPDQPGGHESLLVDPAAQTRVLRDGDAPTTYQRPAEGAAAETPSEGAPADPAKTIHPVVRLPAPGPEPVAPPGAKASMLPASDLPAGLDPDELAAGPPTSARRSRLRKRVSFLRAAREVLLRDLGGFAYELHRTAGDIPNDAHRRLREVKLARLTRLDAELHELELRLDDVRRHVMVREPGVGGECPHCGELFGSDAHYCSHCGLPLTESARRAVAHEAAPPEAAAAEAQPGPPQDQPTEEYSPLRAGDPEFAWPARPAADEAQTGVIGGAAAGAGQPAGGAEAAQAEGADAASADPAATGEADRPTGAEPATGGADPGTGAQPPAAAEAETGADAGRAADAEPPTAGGAQGAAADAEPPANREADAARANREADSAPQANRDADSAPQANRDADAAPQANRDADSAPPADAAPPATDDDPGAAGGDGGAAGRNGTAFSPAERRR